MPCRILATRELIPVPPTLKRACRATGGGKSSWVRRFSLLQLAYEFSFFYPVENGGGYGEIIHIHDSNPIFYGVRPLDLMIPVATHIGSFTNKVTLKVAL